MNVLRAVLKHVASWNCFRWPFVPFWKMCINWNMYQIGTVQTFSDSKYVLLTHCIWSSTEFITENKQTNKTSLPYFWSLCTYLYASGHMRLRYNEVCPTPIWNMFQKCTFFRMAQHGDVKYVSGWHMFQNGTQQTQLCVSCVVLYSMLPISILHDSLHT